MADVFISYAHTTSKQAQAAAAALRAAGFSVWLDDDLAVHREFTQAIEEQLTAAKAALVIWSADAARSAWVLSEANRAREDRKLVQLVIDRTRLPMPFDQVQCADFAGWTGESEHPNWRRVIASIGELVEGKAGASMPTRQPAPLSPAPAGAEPLLAVLAFDNLSGDPEMAYFSDGVSEEIQQTVAGGADLKVIGRASSFQFRGADKAAARIAQALSATHVLDGSVRRAGSRVRIAAQLVECRGETTLWSDRFDRDLTDIFALQDEIAAEVARALKTTFARAPPPPPIDPAVYELFLRSRTFAYSETNIQQVRNLEEVVARAPAFARGWAVLARARAFTLLHYGAAAAAAGLTPDQATQAAETALRLDPGMGLAYLALADLEPWAAYAAREALHEKALAAAPNDADVLANVSRHLNTVGRIQEGLALARRAYELDPMSPMVPTLLGVNLSLAGQDEEASRVTDAALTRWPELRFLAANAMLFAAQRGNRTRVEELIRSLPADAAGDEALRNSIPISRNMLAPDPDSIRAILQDQQDALARAGTVSLYITTYLYRWGLEDEAFELLDRTSFAQAFRPGGTPPAGGASQGVIFNRSIGICSDPRFPRLCAKLGLADYWLETGKWPDCADDVPYDFRAEVRRYAKGSQEPEPSRPKAVIRDDR
jgi:adenylate cyclase